MHLNTMYADVSQSGTLALKWYYQCYHLTQFLKSKACVAEPRVDTQLL